MPYTPEEAIALAEKLGPLHGLGPHQLPTTIFDAILNGLEECQAVLAAMPQQDTPSPLVEYVPVRTVEPGAKGWGS
ncbi:hypothetical protein [Miltoncostaea marina]|uniref:hypothetical protein n=1 Tax=Miltoncostaea marina TaxID=2843215 RepID=UPI001C3D5AF3|nr:hypothetical protein [Miltoncostaea marina]